MQLSAEPWIVFPKLNVYIERAFVVRLVEQQLGARVTELEGHPFARSAPIVRLKLQSGTDTYLRGPSQTTGWSDHSVSKLLALPRLYEDLRARGVSCPVSLIGNQYLTLPVSSASGSTTSTPFIIEEALPGVPFDHVSPTGSSFVRFAEDLGRQVHALHSYEPDKSSAYSQDVPENQQLLNFIGSSPRFDDYVADNPSLHAMLHQTTQFILRNKDQLELLHPFLGKQVFIHGDLAAGNVLFSQEQANVVDFEWSGYAPFGQELAPIVQYIMVHNEYSKLILAILRRTCAFAELDKEQRTALPVALLTWAILAQIRFLIYLAETDPVRLSSSLSRLVQPLIALQTPNAHMRMSCSLEGL